MCRLGLSCTVEINSAMSAVPWQIVLLTPGSETFPIAAIIPSVIATELLGLMTKIRTFGVVPF